jgi:hypothetical protein
MEGARRPVASFPEQMPPAAVSPDRRLDLPLCVPVDAFVPLWPRHSE